jgi:hypothetical protein
MLQNTGENIADRMREPLLEYTNSSLQETIMMLLYNLTGHLMVYMDRPVAFSCTYLNGGTRSASADGGTSACS